MHRINVKEKGHEFLELFKKANKKLKISQELIGIFPVSKMSDGRSYIYVKGHKKAGQEYDTFYDFLDHITYLGMNRYSSYSYNTGDIGLIQLDAVVYIIRRYCSPIGDVIGKEGRPLEKKTKADIDEEKRCSINCYLEDVAKKDSPLKNYLLKDNFYYPKKIKHGNYSVHQLLKNQNLDNLYCIAENGNIEQKEIYIKAANYLLDNLKYDNKKRNIIEDNVRSIYD
jgi:hypothetical protein